MTWKVKDGVIKKRTWRMNRNLLREGGKGSSHIGKPVCAKNGGLIKYGNYESDTAGVGESRVNDSPFFGYLDRW